MIASTEFAYFLDWRGTSMPASHPERDVERVPGSVRGIGGNAGISLYFMTLSSHGAFPAARRQARTL
jgi:hypothetical protein